MQDILLSVGVSLGFSCLISICCRVRRNRLLQQQLQSNIPSHPFAHHKPTTQTVVQPSAPPAPVATQQQPQYVVYMPPQIYGQPMYPPQQQYPSQMYPHPLAQQQVSTAPNSLRI
jgi:hypothetical protein